MNQQETARQLASLTTILQRDLEEREPTGITIELLGSVVNDAREAEGLERVPALEWCDD